MSIGIVTIINIINEICKKKQVSIDSRDNLAQYIRGRGNGSIEDRHQLSSWLMYHRLILLGGNNGHQTRIITAYNPCKNKIVNLGTTYQQQRRYFVTRKKDLTCPLALFRRNLIKQIKKWRESGDKIILFMDHNKNLIKGPMGKDLGDRNRLDLQQAIVQHTGTSPGATFFLWIKADQRNVGLERH
jgi:hypothetical protein